MVKGGFSVECKFCFKGTFLSFLLKSGLWFLFRACRFLNGTPKLGFVEREMCLKKKMGSKLPPSLIQESTQTNPDFSQWWLSDKNLETLFAVQRKIFSVTKEKISLWTINALILYNLLNACIVFCQEKPDGLLSSLWDPLLKISDNPLPYRDVVLPCLNNADTRVSGQGCASLGLSWHAQVLSSGRLLISPTFEMKFASAYSPETILCL